MIGGLCNWWMGEGICGVLAQRLIREEGCPAREVCAEHYNVWSKFLKEVK